MVKPHHSGWGRRMDKRTFRRSGTLGPGLKFSMAHGFIPEAEGVPIVA
jgi:hypothetical protein